jgi:large subunit ribosomal protein L4
MDIRIKDSESIISVDELVFNYQYNEGLIHQAVVTLMNNARSGNSAQKTRAEVRGGGKKPWKQKGTGRARAGSIRSPIWRGGGVTFASKPRDYSQKINKKMYNRAIRSILSELLRQERLEVIGDFQCPTHKTKDFLHKMKELHLTNALIVVEEIGEQEYLGSRNLKDFFICDTYEIDPVILLRFEKVVITDKAMKCLEEVLQ